MRYDDVFANIIGVEGGSVNSVNDPGRETKFGISKRAYPDVDIKNLTLQDAKAIYFNDFWKKLGCEQMAEGLDEFVFDFAVNSGVPTVARLLQSAVGALPDGVVGAKTLALVGKAPPLQIARNLFVQRAIIFASAAPNVFEENSHGWYARLFDKTLQLFNKVK